jgi:pimeloyl-ACP methyl ester carboxylesterase
VPTFDFAGVSIHYEVFGEGKPIMLVHGFASSLQGNWVAPGWIGTLTPLRQVIALDCRGHGESAKLYDPSMYGDALYEDVIRLMDHLGVERADLFGYSMGGRIALALITRHAERFDRVVLGGVGAGIQRREPVRAPITAAMQAGSSSEIGDPMARGFRIFAERTGADLKALAAVRMSGYWRLGREELAKIASPVLIVVGENDTVVGSAEPLAKAIPGAKLVFVPDRDHLTVVGDQRFKDAVVAFLSE